MCITFTESISVWIPLSSTLMDDILRDSGIWNGGCMWTVCLFPIFLVYLPVKRSRKCTFTAQCMTKEGLDMTEPHEDSVVQYLGVIGLHRTNSTLPQQPRVKGFSPPWNFLFICNENFSTSAALDFWPITWSCYSLGSHHDLKFQVFWWTITHFPRLTCSFVVRPVATRTIWKHANPITGMKKRPDMLMMDKLTQCCQGATHITGEMIQTELTNNY